MSDLFAREIATEPPDAGAEGERRNRDAYFTPDPLAHAICGRLIDDLALEPKTILEPGCGGGAFLRAAVHAWPEAKLLGIDIEPCCKGPGKVKRQDLFDPKLGGAFDLVLGNPPFDEAERFILRGLDLLAPSGILAFLLRIAISGGTRENLFGAGRNPIFRLYPIGPRPSFTGGGSDKAQEYALIVWRNGHRGEFRGSRLLWDKPRKRGGR